MEELPRVTPALPKLLKARSWGRGEGVGTGLRGCSRGVGGLPAVGLAITVPQNSEIMVITTISITFQH